MNKTEARRIARARSAELRAAREEAARREREEAERIARERDDANEADLIEFFQLDASLEAAREAFEKLQADHERKRNAVIGRIFAREKKAKTVGDLVGLPPARVTAMRRAHEAASAEAGDQDRSTEQSGGRSSDREQQMSQESTAAATSSAAGEAPQLRESDGSADEMAHAAQQEG